MEFTTREVLINNHNYILRKALPSDATKLNEIERKCFNNEKENFDLVLNSENYFYLVLQDKNNIVAYVGVSVSFEVADILYVCVDPLLRKQGYACLLFENLFLILKQNRVERILLEVNENNTPAINLYLKLGFNQISIRKNYYGTESAIIMQKNL